MAVAQGMESTQEVLASHLLLNAFDIHLQYATAESMDRRIEERPLMSALREATRQLLEERIPVRVKFDWIEDDFFFSPQVGEEIVELESIGLMAEERGCRWLFLTKEGEEQKQGLLADLNGEIDSKTVETIRRALTQCLRP
jgi:hypothetical protein